MKRGLSILLYFLISGSTVLSQHALLSGDAPQFAEKQLFIEGISNPITGDTFILDSIEFNRDGKFNCRIELKKSQWIYINTGIFRLHMFLEPGKNYSIELPPYIPKSESDIRNPFFQPVSVHIQLLMDDPQALPEELQDLNTKIFRFDTLVLARNNEMKDAFIKKKSYSSDSLIASLEKLYTADTSSYFKKYRNYRYGILKLNSRDVGLSYIYNAFMKDQLPQTANPAYMELFREMFKDFFFYFSRTEQGRSLKTIIDREHNFRQLMDTLMNHEAVPNEEMAELLILQEIYEIYSKEYFYKRSLEIILDSITADPVIPEHGLYATEIKKYLTRLNVGYTPPFFSLLDSREKEKKLSDFEGKYIYLNFCTPDNYSCLKEFPFMKAISKKHHKYLEIVTIMVADSIADMQSFMEKNDYDWPALFYGNDEKLLSNYKVMAYPTCYLLDREGKIIQSPANLATEGFEQQLFRIMRAKGDL